jgi:hypothetical protein
MNVEAVLELTLEIARTFWREHPDENARRGTRVVCLAPPRIPTGQGGALQAASLAALGGLVDHLRAELSIVGVAVDLLRQEAGRADTIARAIASIRGS